MFDNLFVDVLNMSLIGGYAILFVIFARLLLKKTPKIFSFALWAVVLLRLLCPFTFESVIGLLPKNTEPIPQNIAFQAQPQIDTGIPIINNAINPILPAPPDTMASVNPLQIWIFIGVWVWIAGMALMLIYSIVQLVRLRRKLVGATPLRDNIYLADHIDSPFVMGLVKPKIYLPSSLSSAEQEFIIAHEKHHIKRFDHITRILSFIALAIHWFNPLVWIAFVLAGKDMEMSCDEAVMKKMDTDIRADYSQSLLRFATGKRLIAATPLAFGEGNTKGRVKNVMKYKKPLLWVSIVAVIAVICVAVALISNQKPKPMQIGADGVSVERLWENRTEYVGNNAAVGNIIYGLSFPDNVQYKNFELKTKEQPYEIIVHFNGVNNTLQSIDYGNGQTETVLNIDFAQFEQNARIMFSLIGNVEKITFSVNRKESGTLTNDFLRNNYDELFAKTAEYEGFQTVLAGILDNSNANTIADFQAIEIGTTIQEIHNKFGEPNEMLSGAHGEIYLVGDKRVTIYYDFNDDGSNTVARVAISDYTPEPLTHDQAVTLALTREGNNYYKGECIGEGHIILGYDDSDQTKTKIYALTMTGWYAFQNNSFVKASGTGVIPAVVTVDSNSNVEIEYPLDGSGYAPSIEKLFPKKYHKRVFNYADGDYEELHQQEQKYAKEYLSKIGRDVEIGNYGDFEHTLLTDLGVSVEASNELQNFYKQHNYYPDFIGNCEVIEDGKRMVYELSYHEAEAEIRFTKYNYDTKEEAEQFVIDAKTGKLKGVSTESEFLNHPDGVKFQAAAYKAARAYLNADSEELAEYLSPNCIVDVNLELFKDIDYMILKWNLNDIKSKDKIHAAYEFKIKGEDSVSFVTMELIKINDEWKVDSIGLEK